MPTSWCGTRTAPSPSTPRPCTCGSTTRPMQARWPEAGPPWSCPAAGRSPATAGSAGSRAGAATSSEARPRDRHDNGPWGACPVASALERNPDVRRVLVVVPAGEDRGAVLADVVVEAVAAQAVGLAPTLPILHDEAVAHVATGAGGVGGRCDQGERRGGGRRGGEPDGEPSQCPAHQSSALKTMPACTSAGVPIRTDVTAAAASPAHRRRIRPLISRLLSSTALCRRLTFFGAGSRRGLSRSSALGGGDGEDVPRARAAFERAPA